MRGPLSFALSKTLLYQIQTLAKTHVTRGLLKTYVPRTYDSRILYVLDKSCLALPTDRT
jgi:hypothetical protein